MHQLARDSLTILVQQKQLLHFVPQNVYEGWVVATRPVVNNGLGLAPEVVHRLIGRLPKFFRIAHELPGMYAEWLRLVKNYSVSGVNAHDARIVAAMKINGISDLLTFNPSDFARFNGKEINVRTPTDVIAAVAGARSSQI